MKKVIALSAVLVMGTLGMACGDVPANNANVNKPVMTPAPATPAPTVAAVNTIMNSNSTMANNSNGKAMDSKMAPAANDSKTMDKK